MTKVRLPPVDPNAFKRFANKVARENAEDLALAQIYARDALELEEIELTDLIALAHFLSGANWDPEASTEAGDEAPADAPPKQVATLLELVEEAARSLPEPASPDDIFILVSDCVNADCPVHGARYKSQETIRAFALDRFTQTWKTLAPEAYAKGRRTIENPETRFELVKLGIVVRAPQAKDDPNLN